VALFYLARFEAIRPLQDAVTLPIQRQIDEDVYFLKVVVVLAEAYCNKV
jgi:hypothetical protein